MKRVVLDTNIFVSFLITSKKTSISQIYNLWQKGGLVVYLSNQTLIELTRVLLSKKIRNYTKLSKEEIKRYLKAIIERSVLITVSDNKFLGLAEKAEADYIITGDKHLLDLKKHKKTKILSPQKFISTVVLTARPICLDCGAGDSFLFQSRRCPLLKAGQFLFCRL